MTCVKEITLVASPFEPNMETACGLVVALFEPSNWDILTLMVNPSVDLFESEVGAHMRNLTVMSTADDTKPISISKSRPEDTTIIQNRLYSFRLLAIEKTKREGQFFPVYQVLVSELEEDIVNPLEDAFRLEREGKWDDAAAVYERIVQEFATATNAKVRLLVARSALNRASILGRQQRLSDAIRAFDEVISLCRDPSIPGFQETTARALNNKGLALAKLGRVGEALTLFQEVASSFEKEGDPSIRRQVLIAKERISRVRGNRSA